MFPRGTFTVECSGRPGGGDFFGKSLPLVVTWLCSPHTVIFNYVSGAGGPGHAASGTWVAHHDLRERPSPGPDKAPT